MGTNYYLHTDCCESCGRGDDRIHIGKSSAGWAFGLHVGGDAPDTFVEWMAMLVRPGAVIRDEYGEVVSVAELLGIMLHRRGRPEAEDKGDVMGPDAWFDKDTSLWRNGYLSKGVVDGVTIDLCEGDFS